MKLWNKKPEEDKYSPKEYNDVIYQYLGDCIHCNQPCINAVYFPSSYTKEEPWMKLYAKQIIAYRILPVPNNTEWSINEQKLFFAHWECPTEKVKIPEDIQIRCGMKIPL